MSDWTEITTDTDIGDFPAMLSVLFGLLRCRFMGITWPANPVPGQPCVRSDRGYRAYTYTNDPLQGESGWVEDALLSATVLALKAELEASRGTAASLDARLDVALNEDGTLKTTTTSSTWANETAAVAYASASSFTITGQDRTAVYTNGRALKLTQTASGYAYVTSASYAGGNTTVAIYGGTVDTGLSQVAYSDQTEAMPYGAASTTNKGVSELATEAEAKALADAARPITPANLAAVLADHGAFPGNKNAVINGCCRVQQRTATPALSGTLQFGPVDRWMVNAVNATAGIIGAAAPAATDVEGGAAIQLSSVSITSGGYVTFVQRIAAKDARRIVGKKVSCRAKVYHGISGSKNVTLTIRRADSSDNFSSTTQVVASPAVAVIGGAWTLVKFEGLDLSGDSNVANGVQFEIKIATDTCSSATISLGALQVEVGSVCTDFEMRPLTKEQDLCDFYCQAYNFVNYDCIGLGTANGTETIDIPFRYRRVMRAAPTVSLGTASYWQVPTGGAAATTATTTGAIKAGSCILRFTRTGAGLTNLGAYSVSTQDGARTLILSAEL